MATFAYDASLDAQPAPAALDFHDTQFFLNNASGCSPQLPTPASLRALCPGQQSGTVVLKDLGLFVKFGPYHKVSVEEAQTMQAVRRAFPNNEVLIPELVAWRRSENINFIYMSLIPGVTLEDSWPSLTEKEKVSITTQLKHMVSLLRTLRQHPAQQFIGIDSCTIEILVPAAKVSSGSISRTKVQDIFFHADEEAGPFSNARDFNDRLQFWAMQWLPLSKRPPDPYRALLPNTSSIRFSHADLHLANIMISGPPGSRSVAAILDWGMSGWYPEYWEYCKMVLGTCNEGDDFGAEGWLSNVLELYDMEYGAFVTYWQWRGVP